MAQVTLTLGSPTTVAGNNSWLQWDVRDMPVNLGDITALSDDPANNPRYLTRVRIWRLTNARCQVQTVEVPGGGTSGFADRFEELSVAWEQYARAITVQYAGGADFVIPGPDNPNNSVRDDTEWYQWDRSADVTAQSAWYDDYQTAGRPSVTVVLDDGATPLTPSARIRTAVATGIPVADAIVRTTVPVRAFTAAGVPHASAIVRTAPPVPAARIRAPGATGVPHASAIVRATPAPARVATSAASGVPTVTARVRATPPGARQVAAPGVTGVPQASAIVRTVIPVDAQIRGSVSTGIPVVAARVRVPDLIPGAPTGLVVTGRAFTELAVRWQQPRFDGGAPIVRYEVRVGGGVWVDVGLLTFRVFTLLAPGVAYVLSVRAVNHVGGGPAATVSVSTLAATVPSAPRHLAANPVTSTVVELVWVVPGDTGGAPVVRYETQVIDGGQVGPWEPAGIELRAFVRGLSPRGFRFRVRAVNSVGPSSASEIVEVRPVSVRPVAAPVGALIVPLLDVERQMMRIRLGGVDCRLTVWWQPISEAWYLTVEAPRDTLVVSGRQLTVGQVLTSGAQTLPGDLYCWPGSSDDQLRNPTRQAWASGTHLLIWAP